MIQEPTQLTPTPGASTPSRGRGLWIGIVIAVIIAIAVPVVIAMAARAPSLAPDSVIAAGASASPGAKPDKVKAPKANRGLGAIKGIGPGNVGKGAITIRAISGSQLSLATEDGWTRTITVASDTVVTKGGATVGVGDLAVGDTVRFKQVRNADGSFKVTAVVVPTPKAGGEVTKVDGDQITVKGPGGATRVITVTGSTVYKVGKAAGSKADVKVGAKIDAQGTASGDNFTATAVHIGLAHANGKVTAKTGNSITVQKPDGSSTVIHVSGSTAYKGKGNTAGTLADVAVGGRVNAEGTARADGSLDAVTVHAGPAAGAKDKLPKAPKAPKANRAPAASPGS